MSARGDQLRRIRAEREDLFDAPCSACDRHKPCMPPAPTCPHPWYAVARRIRGDES